MSDQSAQLAVRPKASQQLAQFLGMESGAMLDAIKAQCFKCDPSKVTNEMLAAFVSVAAAMEVNPFLPDMLYAFPGQGGSIIPIMGPSGVYKKLMEHPEVDSWETIVYPEDVTQPPTHAVTKIWRKGRERPLSYTALVAEWKLSGNPNWNSRCRHMISLRSLKHCARQIIHGIPYDTDDREIMGEINVTPAPEAPAPERPAPPKREKKGAAAAIENAKAQAPIDVPATPVAEKPAEPKPAAEAKPESPAAQPTPPTTGVTPRAFLQDGEKFTGVVEVVDIKTMIAGEKDDKGVVQPKGTVSVIVKGDFNGTVLHVGGGTIGDNDDVTPLPVWQPGAKVKVALLGKKQKSGIVLAKVETAEGLSASPAVQEVE